MVPSDADVVKHVVPDTPLVTSSKSAVWPWWKGGFEFATLTRIGLRHDENEDSARTGCQQSPWIIVADGVGGGALGAVASKLLVERFDSYATVNKITPEGFSTWLHDADKAIAVEIKKQGQSVGAATFAGAVSTRGFGSRWVITWVGDCRAYRYRVGQSIEQLTIDQTYSAMNERPPPHAGPDDPARMVGCGAIADHGWLETTMRAGDTLFACSDGVHKFVDETRMATILEETSDLSSICRNILRDVSLARGHDDATIVIVRRHRWFGANDLYWFLLGVATIVLGTLSYLDGPI